MKDYLDTKPVSAKALGGYFGIDGKQLETQYRDHLSDFHQWDQLEHVENWILFPENIGERVSLDETSLSMGELYTIITNKDAKGQKGALIAMIKGVAAEQVVPILNKITLSKRKKVKEVTLDMAGCMAKIVRSCFPHANLVIDRFHVQKLAYDALQEIRIKHRWEVIDQENDEMDLAKETGQKFKHNILENGETMRQLLARSRYLLFKAEPKWTPSQRWRAEILFNYFPDLEKAHKLVMQLGSIYSKYKEKGVATAKLALWYNRVEDSGFKSFGTVVRTMRHNYQNILNFFDNRSTNAAAESFNAKIKAFRSQFRGVRDVKFFLYRLSKIYA